MISLIKLEKNIEESITKIEDRQRELFDLLEEKDEEIKYLKFKNNILEKQLLKLKLRIKQ